MLFLLLFAGLSGRIFAQSAPYGQCGGIGWTGPTTCTNGWTCVISNPYYSQCLAGTLSATATSATASVTGIAATAPTNPPSHLTGQTPALGWNSWNAYACSVNETKVLAAANAFISLGLKDAGYQYVNIDDCWPLMARNATDKTIVPDPTKFPSGISGVAAQVHALGLKIGIYGDAGTATCAGFPGSLGMEALDAATFASWGIDYLKYDNCNIPANWSDGVIQNNDWYDSNSAVRYRQMGGALAGVSRPIQFSLCLWGNYEVWEWGARVGHSWRMSSDATPAWSFITYVLGINVNYLDYIDFYAHNDMDMMEIGNGGLTIQEQRTHFAAWIFMKSPILLGTNLNALNSTQLAIITNSELLAFHQDTTVGAPAKPFTPYSGAPTTSPPEYYAGASVKGIHFFIINTSSSAATKTVTLSNIPGLGTSATWIVHDMWAKADLPGTHSRTGNFTISVASHDTVAYLLKPA